MARHPQSTASRRICREILGEAIERFNQEFAMELETGLLQSDPVKVSSYHCLVR